MFTLVGIHDYIINRAINQHLYIDVFVYRGVHAGGWARVCVCVCFAGGLYVICKCLSTVHEVRIEVIVSVMGQT